MSYPTTLSFYPEPKRKAIERALAVVKTRPMSKAFTKEDAPTPEADLEQAENDAKAVPGGKNYITPAGANKLREELKQLLDVERPKIVEVVSWAAGNGDRSENGDYIYGKRRLREIDRRIRFLTKRLEIAEIVDPAQQKADRVVFGSTVSVQDEEGKKRTYSIVGIDETEIKRGRISWISPMGRALLKAKVGDTVTVRTPKGDEDLEILKISFEALD
jgi:transcription elongation factor GreB